MSPLRTARSEPGARLAVSQPVQAFVSYSGRSEGVKLRMSNSHAAEEDEHELFQYMQIGHLIMLN